MKDGGETDNKHRIQEGFERGTSVFSLRKFNWAIFSLWEVVENVTKTW